MKVRVVGLGGTLLIVAGFAGGAAVALEQKAGTATPHVDDDPRGMQREAEVSAIAVAQNEAAITVADEAGHTRNFYPDGRTYKADEGASDVKSVWKDGTLVFEKKAARGWKMKETWQLTPEGRLRVDVQLEGSGRPKVVVTRIYDKVAEGQ